MLKDKKGISYVQTAVWVLILSALLSIILTFASAMTVMQMTEDNTQRVLDSFVTENSVLIYNSLKNGSDFTERLDHYFYKNMIFNEFSLDRDGNDLYNKDEQGRIVYRISNPNVAYEWADTLKLNATYTVYIPLRFGNKVVTYINVPQKVTSFYNLK